MSELPLPAAFELPYDDVRRRRREIDQEYSAFSSAPEYREVLLEAASSLLRQGPLFQVGDVVRWKANLKNKRWPEYERPAVVVQVLEAPVFAETSRGDSPTFREPLDLVLGIMDGERELHLYHFDSRRFEAFPA